MRKNKIFKGLLLSGLALAGLTQSCVSDDPFTDKAGEGTLRMQLVVNSNLTRAELDQTDLISKCVIYISQKDRGLLHQYQGVDQLPEELRLKSGSYVAEAWTGDSVTASFTDKFYRGCQSFEMNGNDRVAIVLQCRIANVVVSLDETSVEELGLKNWSLTVGNSRGELEFTPEKIAEKGYFMMPNADIALDSEGNYVPDDEGFFRYKPLNYKLTGESSDGRSFSKTGVIANADGQTQHAHEYVLKMVYNPEYDEAGGSFITIEIDDKEDIVKEEIGLYARPDIKGATFDITKQIQANQGEFEDQIVKVSAFGTIKELQLHTEDSEFGIDKNAVDLLGATDDIKEKTRLLGIDWEEPVYNEEKKLSTCYITFKEAFFNRLLERPDEYVFKIYVKDSAGKYSDADIRIAVGAEAIREEDPVTINPVATDDLLAVRAHRVTLTGSYNDDAEDVKILYRTAGSSESWTTVDVPKTRGASTFSVEIAGLDKNKQYEYKAQSGDWTQNELGYFKTEDEFVLPFADMETWALQGKAWFVGDDYDNNFWDSGNHGSASFGFTLTEASTAMCKSPTQSAKLESIFAGVGGLVGKFAAGNLFVGKFGKAVGTSGAQLDFGQPYDGSHPDALSVWVNYRPASITDVDTKNVPQMTKGSPDQGQLFVAFATKAQAIDTSKGVYFNPDDPSILGYGDANWAQGESVGPEGSLTQVTIPVKWNERARTNKATHIIIVCSASKYGDYFVGGRGSVMYVDDFELVYEN